MGKRVFVRHALLLTGRPLTKRSTGTFYPRVRVRTDLLLLEKCATQLEWQ